MSGTINFVSDRILTGTLLTVALSPPAWTRLEPQSVTGDPAPGLEARLHDPAWTLGRQWQIGEFRGEDAGTPISVHVAMTSDRLTAWQPGDPAGTGPVLPLGPDDPLEPWIEREPPAASGPGLRARAEAGALLVTMLSDAGHAARAALVAACPLPVDAPRPDGVTDAAWALDPLWRTAARACPDGASAAAALAVGAPAWMDGAPAAAATAAAAWLDWYRTQVAPAPGQPDSWVPDRLEYRFSIRAGDAAGPGSGTVFRAPTHVGGAIDWYSVDHDPSAVLQAAGEAPQPGASVKTDFTVLATPLRFAGMPADRLWQFEDGGVAFGKMDVQLHDPARLCLIEFATIYGNDWFSVPLDLPSGSFTRFTEVSYLTTFGERIVVPAADDSGRSGHFRMFGVSVMGQPGKVLPGLLVPFASKSVLRGAAVEDVVLLRDESANMAWAVEKTVPGRSGDPRRRTDERAPEPEAGPLLPGADLRYLLETTVPPNWIPLVPVPTSAAGGFVLRKGTMTDRDQSLGELLHATPFNLQEAEVPRPGLRVRRIPCLSRGTDGRTIRWIVRDVGPGHGEGASRLAFDSATR